MIDIKGVITSVSEEDKFTNIILNSSFLFSFEMTKIDRDFILGEKIKVKSRFVGYDDLFNEYSFTDCDIVQ